MHQNTKELIKKYDIRLTKSLGQNFLIDSNVLSQIADSTKATYDDLVIEVGSGLGNLTVELASRAKHVIAIEIDKRLIPALSENLAWMNNISLINDDVLKIDLNSIVANMEGYKSIRMAGNLPYYITTPVIMQFLEKGPRVKSMCVMIQKEVADRIVAKPGNKNYGALTVAVQYFANPVRLFNVPPHVFIPQPSVDSTVLYMDIYDKPPVETLSKETLFKVIRAAFGQRRKTLLNALSNSRAFPLSKDQFREVLNLMDISENERGENLDIYQFSNLSNLIHQFEK